MGWLLIPLGLFLAIADVIAERTAFLFDGEARLEARRAAEMARRLRRWEG